MDPSRACFLKGRGKPGDDERGSNGGSKAVAGLFLPAMLEMEEADAGGSVGSSALALSIFLMGEEFIDGKKAYQGKRNKQSNKNC